MSPKVAPYGAWKSPIVPQLVSRAARALSMVRWDGSDLYWLEMRPEEKGRTVLLAWTPEEGVAEITPQTASVGSRVHEYGGGDYAVCDGVVYYVDAQDQRIYRLVVGAERSGLPRVVVPITPAPPAPASIRYADLEVSPDGRWVLAVREVHSAEGGAGREPRNDLVRIPTDGSGEPVVVAEGHDFFSTPRLSPLGRHLAFLSWDHPRMPWDGTDLWIADVDERGEIGPARHVAGSAEESIFQPEWSPDGRLHFVSDRTGWWNIYEWSDESEEPDGRGSEVATNRSSAAGAGGSSSAAGSSNATGGSSARAGSQGGESGAGSTIGTALPVTQIEAEIGSPQWVFGLSHYAFLGDRIACVFAHRGLDHLGFLDPHGAHPGVIRRARFPYTYYGRGGTIVSNGHDQIAFVAASSKEAPAVARLVVPQDLSTMEAPEIVRRSSDGTVDPRYVSGAEAIEFPSGDGRTAHALFYPPTNPDHAAPDGELPPLIVKSHGGPTSCSTSELNLGAQFWTSRGFAVVDVNYGGSSGYGRKYRELLRGAWGVVDTEDCVAAARHLADRGLVDGRRMAIRGGSAGGFTTLSALVFHDVFAAGASHYGVADLETLAKDTHKFESRYLDSLVGPYPERRDLYAARSPVHFVDRISCPVILLQGSEDRVVPPSQSEAVVRALETRSIPHAYVLFEGERHGFRQAGNIERALETEYLFYAKVFGFPPADDFAPLTIRGL